MFRLMRPQVAEDYTDFMLRRTAAAAALTLLAAAPALAATAAYDRAAVMATGETTLSKGYDGGAAAGAVKAPMNGASANDGLTIPAPPAAGRARAALKSAAVPAPDQAPSSRGLLIAAALGVAGTFCGFSFGGLIGALIGAAVGVGIGFALLKLLS